MSLKSKPLTRDQSEELERRIEAALAKHNHGEPLTETEQRIVYWVRYAAGCHACGGAGVDVVVRRRPDTG
jgi:hypothetical protein